MSLPIVDIANYCNEKLDFTIPLSDEYFYSNVPLCVIDSVFSIGVRYEGVTNIIKRVRGLLSNGGISEADLTTSQYLKFTDALYPDRLTAEIYNFQRTSPVNGILKTEATHRFLNVLKNYGIERLTDVNKLNDVRELEREIKLIPGQGSGISLKYFYMLSGNEDQVKPDRMIQQFVNRFVSINDKKDEIQYLLRDVAKEISLLRSTKITPRHLDHLIWQYESGRSVK